MVVKMVVKLIASRAEDLIKSGAEERHFAAIPSTFANCACEPLNARWSALLRGGRAGGHSAGEAMGPASAVVDRIRLPRGIPVAIG